MLVFDLHCDLPYKILTQNERIDSNNTCWSLNKIKGESRYIQVFANFIDKFEFDDPFNVADKMINKIISQINVNEQICLITDKETFDRVSEGRENGAILSIEGGEALGGNVDNIKYFYEKGVRILTLTWNYPNQLGEGVGEYTSFKGLTSFGRQVVREMNKIRMAIDVSHITESGFYDVAQESRLPFIASHSNSKTICNHNRNLTDEQFVEIAGRGGIVGINFYPVFLNQSGSANLTDVVKHIEHFMSLGGCDSISLGSDFDGIESVPDGLNDIGNINNLANELVKINYSEELIAKIMYKNAFNYFCKYVF